MAGTSPAAQRPVRYPALNQPEPKHPLAYSGRVRSKARFHVGYFLAAVLFFLLTALSLGVASRNFAMPVPGPAPAVDHERAARAERENWFCGGLCAAPIFAVA